MRLSNILEFTILIANICLGQIFYHALNTLIGGLLALDAYSDKCFW